MPIFPAFSLLAVLPLDRFMPVTLRARAFKIIYLLTCLVTVTSIIFPGYRVRAQDMRTLAPIAEAATLPDQRVVLYNFGEHRWDYRNQLIWYGNRLCDQAKDLNEVRSKLDHEPSTVVIMDKEAFARLEPEFDFHVELLGESEKFVCFQRAQWKPRLDEAERDGR
jgi:hypothetical protein